MNVQNMYKQVKCIMADDYIDRPPRRLKLTSPITLEKSDFWMDTISHAQANPTERLIRFEESDKKLTTQLESAERSEKEKGLGVLFDIAEEIGKEGYDTRFYIPNPQLFASAAGLVNEPERKQELMDAAAVASFKSYMLRYDEAIHRNKHDLARMYQSVISEINKMQRYVGVLPSFDIQKEIASQILKQ